MAVSAASGVLSSCDTDESRLDLSRSASRAASRLRRRRLQAAGARGRRRPGWRARPPGARSRRCTARRRRGRRSVSTPDAPEGLRSGRYMPPLSPTAWNAGASGGSPSASAPGSPSGCSWRKTHSARSTTPLLGTSSGGAGAVAVQPVALRPRTGRPTLAPSSATISASAVLRHRVRGRLRHELGAEPVERRRLLLARDRARLAFSHAARQDADDHADDEEGDQRQPVLGVADVERVVRRQEEEVPGEEGEHGRQHRRAGAGDARHQQDHEEVEERPLPLGEVAAPGEEEQRRHRDGHRGQHVAVPGQTLRGPPDHAVTRSRSPMRSDCSSAPARCRAGEVRGDAGAARLRRDAMRCSIGASGRIL